MALQEWGVEPLHLWQRVEMLYGNLQSSELVLIRETIQVGFVSYSEALFVYSLYIRF